MTKKETVAQLVYYRFCKHHLTNLLGQDYLKNLFLSRPLNDSLCIRQFA